ncbi:hypothetical protein HELRODRAFT_70629, partial [Helobdella robusta]|uniref:SET domain-containing protein n=1 Tax=Helobdella robusta TaxID=6412 RepID=T1G095_HELRO
SDIYVDVKPVSNGFEAHACNCKPPLQSDQMGCSDDDCLNRHATFQLLILLILFSFIIYNFGNQEIQKHQDFRHLKKFPTQECGLGVKATKPLKAGQFIIEYVGEVMSELEFRRRMSTLYSHMQHHYCLSLEGGVVIDGYKSGNISRLINHSCSPNCQMQKWNVNGVYRIGLFALKDVEPNEELTYDYNFHAYNVNTQQACKCGSSNCRLVVGGRSQKDSSSNRKGSYCFTMHLTSNDRLNWVSLMIELGQFIV